MSVKDFYNQWLKRAVDDADLIDELEGIENQQEEIYDRFYKELEFGTAGLRGIIGAGTNRMNIYTVRKTTQGLADYLNESGKNARVAISYDSRIKAEFFAREAACVLAANGIKVYISRELQPTPVLSFAVREYGCDAGIMITASHNPSKYNGYKCYGSDGCQMTEAGADSVYAHMQKLDMFEGFKTCAFEDALSDGRICFIAESMYEKYLQCVQAQCIRENVCREAELSVVYTPLNGAGNKLVREILKRIGVDKIDVVAEQELPDGNFTTCSYPNPETKDAWQLALALAKKTLPDIAIATDPDSDRVGAAVKVGEEYRLLTGNEIGILLANYILSSKSALGTLPENPVVVKTIVSSEIVSKIAGAYGCTLKNVLTGFKYIGEQILKLEQKGEENRYVFGFEESYGYLVGTYVRDKDAVVASMLICEMAAHYKKQGKNLIEVLGDIYHQHGFYQSATLSFSFEGAAGTEKMQQMMSRLREAPPKAIAGKNVLEIRDYKSSVARDVTSGQTQKIELPSSNVLSYSLEGDNLLIVRPSGTEPKIKVYITAVGDSAESAARLNDSIKKEITGMLGV